MIKVDVRDAVNKLNQQFGYVSNNGRKLAIARAINHTLAKSKTQISREIRNIYTLDAKTVNAALSQVKADRLTLTGKVKAKGRPIPLAKFSARQTQKGVSVSILRGRRKIIPGVFLQYMPSSHRGVFVRGKYSQGKIVRRHQRVRPTGSDLPVTQLKGISLPKTLTNKTILTSVAKGINTMFPQRIEHEIKRIAIPV